MSAKIGISRPLTPPFAMDRYELPRYLPTADELPCSDDTLVDNELQEIIPSLLKSILRILLGKPQDRTFRNPKRRRKPRLEIYKLVDSKYELQDSNPFWMPEIGLGIGSERADHDRLTREWLYWYDRDGERYPTPDERIEQERRRADRLEAKLRALGIDPE
jgi:hypothetical protein